jgi:hypothetical protein
MSMRMKILYLLEEMDGLCLDNEEERMEVASRLSAALCPPAKAEPPETSMDELIEELVDSDPLDWELVSGERSLTVGNTRISLRNFGSASNLELSVCGQPMILKPHHRAELFKMCHGLRACEQQRAVAKAVHELRRRRFEET